MDVPEPVDDDVLADLVAGARDERDPAVLQLFAARPGLRERIGRMRALAGNLDEVGAGDRQLLHDAIGQPSPLDAMAHGMVVRHRAPKRRLALLWTLAAVVMTAVLLTMYLSRPNQADEHSTLGPAPGDLWPKGAVERYTEFQWNLPLEPGCSYLLRFRDGGPDGTIVHEVEEPVAMRWVPGKEDLALLPARMSWEVLVVDVGGIGHNGAGPVKVFLSPQQGR